MTEKPAKPSSRASRAPATPHERVNFRRLLTGNPNYFGNLAESIYKPIKIIKYDTNFEEVPAWAITSL
jgi:hypothetical protein